MPTYSLIRAAKYLGVAPWELAERSIAWRDWALEAEAAEAKAQEQVHRQARDRGKLEQFRQGGARRRPKR